MAMSSLTADICALVAMLGLVVFLLFGTIHINHARKARHRMRKATARLLNWK
jgi:hypothetical protein